MQICNSGNTRQLRPSLTSSWHLSARVRPICHPFCVHATQRESSGSSKTVSSVDDALQLAGRKLQETAAWAQDSAQRSWRKLDAEYALQDKAARAAKRLEEQARDVDQQYNIRRRLRNNLNHVQRMWPVWSKKLNAYSATWYGKAVFLTLIFLLLSSPIFWSFVNFVLLAWWLSVPLGMILINSSARREAEKQREAAAAEQREREQNPFANMFRRQSGSAGFQGDRASRAPSYQQPGPVIDADYTIIDESSKKPK